MCHNAILFFAVIFGLLGAAIASSGKHQEDCARKLGVTENFINTELRNVSESKLNDPKIKCIILCVWNTEELAKPNGEFNMTTIVSKLPSNISNRDDVIEAFNECAKLDKKDDPCDTLSQGMKCLFNTPAFCKWSPLGTYCGNNSIH